MNKRRILHIAPGFLYGGIESRLVDWYSAIDRKAIQFDVIKVTPERPNALVDKIQELGGNVYSIPPLGLKTAFKHFKAIKKIMDNGHYDAVHAHSLSYGWYPLRYAKKLGISKRILHSRTTSTNPDDRHIFIGKSLGKMAIHNATHFWGCSEEACKFAFGNRSDTSVIRNGIFLDRYQFDTEKRSQLRCNLGIDNAFVVGFVGRFSPQKNIPFLIECFSTLHQRNKQAVLLLIGDYDNEIGRNAIEQIEKAGIQDYVRCVGRQENIPDWLQAMDVFVAPSLFEGFGTVALEAQANGLPCVLSTGFPRSVKVIDAVQFCEINDCSKWVEAILAAQQQGRTENGIEMARAHGYDVITTAKWLEKFYTTSHIK